MLPRLEVIAAEPDQQVVLENLLELYIHDFSEFIPVDVGEDGRFGYPRLCRYWGDPDHKAFLARVDGKLAGFALLKRMASSPGVRTWDMVEFFVLRRYRRRGAGTQLAETIWRLCPGNWRVRVRGDNLAGLGFWRTAIGRFTGQAVAFEDLEVEGVAWRHFAFQSPD